MSSAPTANANTTPREPSLFAAFLSYLIPGLGQIYQGRYGKGLLFMVSLLGMFMLGQKMGDWQNVYFAPPAADHNAPQGVGRGAAAALINRWHYAGQFWIGIAAWPALWQYNGLPVPTVEQSPFLHDFQKAPDETALNKFLVESDKTPDLGWVYTVVAGMLNILVMYDAYAGPVFLGVPRLGSKETNAVKSEAKTEGVA